MLFPLSEIHFFERIIDYNINFKIVDLYQNLRYALAQTMLYYYILNDVRDVSDLPYELKIRLYQLNNLDLTIQIKKEEIKQLLEKKLSELIEDLKDTAKETYTYYLKESKIIKNSFNSYFLERIDYNLEEIMDELDKKYKEALEKYLKEKFVKSFNDILGIKTEEMLKVFYSEKNKLMQKFDKLFSSKEDNDLKDVNKKINLTLDSIQNFNNYSNTFKISNNVINFFTNYSYSTLLPLFIKFDQDLNNKMKQLIMKDINNKLLPIANLSSNDTYNNILSIQNDFAYNYYDYINLALESYGQSTISYESNLNYTQKKIYERLMNNKNEDDLIEEAKKRVETKDVQETLNLLSDRAFNNYIGIQNLNAIKEFYNKINNYKNDLNIDYKRIRNMIITNKYSEEIITFLLGKLNALQDKLFNYYYQIYEDFDLFELFLHNNMSTIYSYLSQIRNLTEYSLYYKYRDIGQETKQINYNYSNYIEKYKLDKEYTSKSDHMTNKANAYIYDITEYVEFKLNFFYNGGIWEKPKVKAIIVDKSKPNKIDLDLYSSCGDCCDEGHAYNISLNDINFTTVVEYDMNTSSIIINTFTNIDKFYVTESVYRKEKTYIMFNSTFGGEYGDKKYVVGDIHCLKDYNLTEYMRNHIEFVGKNYSDIKIFTK